MTYSNIKVDQINDNYEVVQDYGEILTINEMKVIMQSYFRDTKYENGCLYGENLGRRYCVYFKNVSYLVTPHPFFK